MDLGPLWQIGTALVAAGAVYGAIRADLRAIHQKDRDQDERIKTVEDRFNRHIEQGLNHGNS
ncbi:MULTISPECIES: hypothetical protein [Burkholderia cepacia complex]|uniref:Uncharacterized protein n=2 Tax=Burkholderia cepacia complex TaxID=87882 RepID=A0A6L3MYE1_9BURK|nr:MULTISPECIES: hypothetical protein [Burkholderia cepacia complex]KAB0637257.1 hypothetical protein F7R25_15955 [Burkholderia stagnalis]KVW61779.1 hypothetical protein WT28_15745 [Burkholderia stagnalis]KVW75019.1 hypothetical protein WT29_23305 [Burkholderia stagnalis]KVX78575.1 hypothetical protein WT34_10535 [Burkholderia stagnalis]KWN53941.1 hypothetical protein WT89_23600 [Burkholderia stagnalis]